MSHKAPTSNKTRQWAISSRLAKVAVCIMALMLVNEALDASKTKYKLLIGKRPKTVTDWRVVIGDRRLAIFISSYMWSCFIFGVDLSDFNIEPVYSLEVCLIQHSGILKMEECSTILTKVNVPTKTPRGAFFSILNLPILNYSQS